MSEQKSGEIIERVRGETTARERDRLGLSSRYAAPSDAVEERLAEIWRLSLDVDRIGVDDDFFELGGDSLNGAQTFAAIEHEFERRLPLAALVEGPTIRHLARLLGDAAHTGSDDVLVPLRETGGRPPLFCIHELSGNVVVYRLLVRHLDADQPVYGLQYPGQVQADPPRLGLDDMAARYLVAIREAQPAGPYHLAGFSLGGVIAYEIAWRLRAAGEEVALLALIDAGAPGYAPEGLARAALHASEFLHRWPWTWPAYLVRRWRNRRARQRKDAALYRSRTEGDLGARLERLATEILPGAKPGYAPKPYDGRVVLFRCTEERLLWRRVPEMGWRDLVAGGIEIHDIAATHQYLMQEPSVVELAERLETCLRDARADPRAAVPTAAAGSAATP